MIDRAMHAPPFSRQAVLQQGLRVLLRWSLFLIAHLPKKSEELRERGIKQIQVQKPLLTPAYFHKCQSDLGNIHEADLALLLYTADGCRPGFYSSVLHNPKAVGKLVLDLFESF